MGKAVIAAFRDAGFRDVIIAARNRQRGRRWQNSMAFSGSPCPKDRSRDSGQCHTAGHGGERKATRWRSARPWWPASVVFDVVALPAETPLIPAQQRGKQTISGAEVIALQAVEQFALYTGVRPDSALVAEASAFARSWMSLPGRRQPRPGRATSPEKKRHKRKNNPSQ